MSRGKKKVILSFALVLCIVFAIAVPHFVHAEEVIVERYKDTSLQFIAIHGKDNYNKNAWDPIGSYDEDLTKRNYQIHSNAFAPWFTKDSVHFAYKKMDFAYGKQGTLVLETVLNSFNATESVNAALLTFFSTSDRTVSWCNTVRRMTQRVLKERPMIRWRAIRFLSDLS